MVGNEESFLCLCYVEPFWWWGISLNWVVVELEFWKYICFFRNLKPSGLEGFRALKPRQIEVFRGPMPNFTPFLPKISPFCLLLAHLNKATPAFFFFTENTFEKRRLIWWCPNLTRDTDLRRLSKKGKEKKELGQLLVKLFLHIQNLIFTSWFILSILCSLK